MSTRPIRAQSGPGAVMAFLDPDAAHRLADALEVARAQGLFSAAEWQDYFPAVIDLRTAAAAADVQGRHADRVVHVSTQTPAPERRGEAASGAGHTSGGESDPLPRALPTDPPAPQVHHLGRRLRVLLPIWKERYL